MHLNRSNRTQRKEVVILRGFVLLLLQLYTIFASRESIIGGETYAVIATLIPREPSDSIPRSTPLLIPFGFDMARFVTIIVLRLQGRMHLHHFQLGLLCHAHEATHWKWNLI